MSDLNVREAVAQLEKVHLRTDLPRTVKRDFLLLADLARRLASYVSSLEGKEIPNPHLACALLFESEAAGLLEKG